MGKIPNAVDLGRLPKPVRYIWCVIGPMGVHSGATWGGLRKALERDPESTLYMCDLKRRKIVKEEEEKEYILAAWRDSYWEPEWNLDQEI